MGLRCVDQRPITSEEQAHLRELQAKAHRWYARLRVDVLVITLAAVAFGVLLAPPLVGPEVRLPRVSALLVFGSTLTLMCVPILAAYAESLLPVSSFAPRFTRTAASIFGLSVIGSLPGLRPLPTPLEIAAAVGLISILPVAWVGARALVARVQALSTTRRDLRNLDIDLREGCVLRFEAPEVRADVVAELEALELLAPPPDGAASSARGSPQAEALAHSGVVLSMGGQAQRTGVKLDIRSLDMAAAHGANAPLRVEGVHSTKEGVGLRQRRLSAHEREELAGLLRKELWRLLGWLVGTFYFVGLVIRVVEQQTLGGPKAGLGWPGLVVTSLLVVAFHAGNIRAHLRCRKDLRDGLLIVALLEDVEGEKLEESLAISGRSWTLLGRPASWRVRS